jgi:hypothetical protein
MIIAPRRIKTIPERESEENAGIATVVESWKRVIVAEKLQNYQHLSWFSYRNVTAKMKKRNWVDGRNYQTYCNSGIENNSGIEKN